MLRVGIRSGSDVTPPLLIFIGEGANLELVDPFAASLEGVETIIFDVPVVGGSALPPRPYRLSHLARMATGLLAKQGYQGQVDAIGISWGGALAQQFALLYPNRCRRLILASTSPDSITVPGRLSAITKPISPHRYSDPEFFNAAGGVLYGGVYRRYPGLLHEHSRHIRPPRAVSATSTNCSAQGGGPAFRASCRCANRYWSCTPATARSAPDQCQDTRPPHS